MRASAKADRPRLVYPSTEFEFEMDGIRELFREYAQSLQIDLCFQIFCRSSRRFLGNIARLGVPMGGRLRQ
jgi:hypothetical protein